MDYNIRKIEEKEYILLEDFIYEAIFIPEGAKAPDRNILSAPELQVYVEDFGTRESDICFVAEVAEEVVGAVWVRIMDDYGHVDEGVPSFAISLYLADFPPLIYSFAIVTIAGPDAYASKQP